MTPCSRRFQSFVLRRGALAMTALFALAGAAMATGFTMTTLRAQEHEPWVISPRRAAVPNPVAKTDQAIAMGQELYEDECATCHGATGQNDGPGAKKIAEEMKRALLLTDPKVQEQSDGALFVKITEGRDKMPSLEKDLSDQERWQIVHFLRTFAK